MIREPIPSPTLRLLDRLPNKIDVVHRILWHLERGGVDLTDRESCWRWPRSVSVYGYGRTGGDPLGDTHTHRVMYRECVGPIPQGLEIDHKCHVDDVNCRLGSQCPHRSCCNPWHLRAVTGQENKAMMRGQVVGRCPTGEHEFDPERAYRGGCRDCYNDRAREANRRLREKRRDLGLLARARVSSGDVRGGAERTPADLERIRVGAAGECPHCDRVIRCGIPPGGDGSVRTLITHGPSPVRCAGSRASVPGSVVEHAA